jgi:hypothetical protein
VITEIEEVEAAKKKVSDAINANEGEVWPFNVWEAWQDLERSVVTLRESYEDLAADAKFEGDR